MMDVPVDVVVELGTVSIALEALAHLAVGDTLPLGLPIDEPARVCVGGAPLFRGRPTVHGQAVGVSLEREEWHAA
jgi:flagellar motor switch protein FliM